MNKVRYHEEGALREVQRLAHLVSPNPRSQVRRKPIRPLNENQQRAKVIAAFAPYHQSKQ